MPTISAHVVSEELLTGDGAHGQVTGRPVSPETEIWLAVVARCWADAFEMTDAGLRNIHRTADPAITRGESRRWLTLSFGDWAEDRETVCDLAGIDSDVVRQAAVERLKLAKIEDVERRAEKIEALDLAFEKLVARSGGMRIGDTNRALRCLADREFELALA